MKMNFTLFAAASTALFLGSATCVAYAKAQPTAETKTANQDFTKLSAQGMTAIRDVGLARLAIFNGHIDLARQNIDAADTALGNAKMDDTAFMKAETDLNPPAGVNQPKTDAVAKQWLPINSTMSLAEDYKASPQKTAGVAKANEQIKKGDKKGAMNTLKLAGVDVTFTEELTPLKATVSGVRMAKTDIDAGHFYEANQDLKGVEDGIRFDTSSAVGVPTKTASAKVHS